MAKRKRKGICNVIVISDKHANCRLGLCPKGGLKLDDGGIYKPSKLQKIVWSWWEKDFWKEWVPTVTRGEPFAVVDNGDAVDGGAHHGNTTHISANPDDQERLALEIMRPVVEACGGRYYHIRGTEAHGGKSACDEERLARQLGAIPDKEGRHARWELWLRVGGEKGGLVHFLHHIGTTGRTHYETSALSGEMGEAFVEAGRWGEEYPDVIVRSHRHRNAEVRIQTKKGFCTCFTTAGWQLKTPFTYKIAGARQSLPQIGGSLIRYGDEDTFTRHFVKELSRPQTEILEVGNGKK